MDRYLVVSSDGHAGLPPERYRDYLEAKHHAEFDRRVAHEIATREQHEKNFLLDDFNTKWRARVGDGLQGAWDPTIRNRVLDGDGVAAEVLFPDGITERNAPPFGADIGLRPSREGAELQWAGARAHNRWMADFCKDEPVRRIGLAIIPALYDVETNLREIRWARESGLRGVVLPTLMDGFDYYNHPKYNPMWDLLQELDMPVHFHSGAAAAYDINSPGWIGIYLSEYAFWLTRPMWTMIFGGVFETYPRLKAMFTEAGGEFWFPWVLELMDIRASVKHTSGKLGDHRSNLTMKPSDYFRRNVWVGCSALPDEETTESYYKIGVDRVMWGTDYPHPEGTWPNTLPKMVESLGGLPDADVARMLAGNAVEAYDLDLPALNAIAARIGPFKSSFVKAA